MKALVIDNGLFPDVARRLAQENYSVGYFSSWVNSFPESRRMMVGTGVDGVERVDEPNRYMMENDIDLVVVPDLYLGDYEAAALSMKIPTVGSRTGARLETDRWFLKQFLSDNDLDVPLSEEIEGIEALHKHLQSHPNTFVKVSVFRGDMETRSAKDWLVEYHDFHKQVGELGQHMRFICEDEIPDALEIGIDGWWWRGVLLTPFVVGCEIKDAGYVGYVCGSILDLPEEAQKIVRTLGKYFASTGYANFFSNEMRVLKSGETFMTDATCRVPSPPGGALMRACQNFGEVMRGLANDKPVAPDFGDAKYISELVLTSDWLHNHSLEVNFPKAKRDDYTFHNYCVLDGKLWILPHSSGLKEFGSALGSGTLEGSLKEAQANAEAVEAHDLTFGKDALQKAQEAMAKAATMGYAP